MQTYRSIEGGLLPGTPGGIPRAGRGFGGNAHELKGRAGLTTEVCEIEPQNAEGAGNARFGADQLIGIVCEIRRGPDRIGLDRRGWRWVSRGIALVSGIEGIAFACAAAVRRRWLPQRLLGRVGEARVLAAVGGCRRATIGRLLRTMDSTSAGTE
jgi:hypothetical protein